MARSCRTETSRLTAALEPTSDAIRQNDRFLERSGYELGCGLTRVLDPLGTSKA